MKREYGGIHCIKYTSLTLIAILFSTFFAIENVNADSVDLNEYQAEDSYMYYGDINDENLMYSSGNALIPEDTKNFINEIKLDAYNVSKKYNLHYELMIAQAILESDSGKSDLSLYDNNLFGIKGLYKDKGTIYQTWEDDGTDEGVYVDSYFRSYSNFYESIEDYAQLLRNGLDEDPYFYSDTWLEYSDLNQAIYSLSGRYATDRLYGEKLVYIIKNYGLSDIGNQIEREKAELKNKKEQDEKNKQEKLKNEELKRKEIEKSKNKELNLYAGIFDRFNFNKKYKSFSSIKTIDPLNKYLFDKNIFIR